MATIVILPNRPAVTIQDVFDRNQYNLRDAAKNSNAWFNKQARELGTQGYTARRLLKGVHGDWNSYPEPGKLYMFSYDAKHKATLPYWDKFPLVFPFKSLDNGFLGLNMHYLPYQARIRILDSLIGIKLRKNSIHYKIQLSWDLITSVSTYKPLQACVHRYLYTQLTSGLRQIDSGDWGTAMLLPIQQFVGATTSYVHKQSKLKGGF